VPQTPITRSCALFFKPFWVVLGDVFNGLVGSH